MAKEKKIFYCTGCGYESSKWMGQCPGCKEWNTFTEEKVTISAGGKKKSSSERVRARKITDIGEETETRIKTDITELDRVLGGGIVKGSLVLIGGDPGIGKSTLLLQMCAKLTEKDAGILYVSGEESMSQIMMRGKRLGAYNDRLIILCDNDMDNIEERIMELSPDVVIIDSIQTMEDPSVDNAQGTVTQVREVTGRLMRIAKTIGPAVFIVGHVTKEGQVAGPRTLEHMVDSVLYFEGDESEGMRLLRAVKNRFGSTNEIGVFSMTDKGLEEVTNPSELLLSGRPKNVPGSAVIPVMEGSRSILVELQALCAGSSFNMPRRTAVGLDYNRVNLILAVLERRAGIVLSGYDCYVNITGGVKVYDPSTDLGIAVSIVSSFRNRPVPSDMAVLGEIGLTGEIRGVSNVLRRAKEAGKLGFKRILLPESNRSKDLEGIGIEPIYVSNVREAIDAALE